LSEVVDEQHVECGVVLTQPSQETQDDTNLEEPVCRSVDVGDTAVDTGFILGVDSQPIATGYTLNVDPSFVESEFMLEYEAVFADERAGDSADD
jgi:hypothetical protein